MYPTQSLSTHPAPVANFAHLHSGMTAAQADAYPMPSELARESRNDGGDSMNSGAYVTFAKAGPANDARPSKLRLSLLRAIHSGYEVYRALPPDDLNGIHRRGRKLQSFRKLATNSQMAVSTLWRALATYMLYRRHPEIAEYRNLGVGHVSVVLSVEEEYQLYFLRNAEIGHWSRRRLDDEVKFYHAYRAQHGRREGVSLSS